MQDELQILENLKQYLDNLNYSDVSLEEIAAVVKKAMDKYEMISVLLQSRSIFHRGIGYNRKPEKFTELIYPPAEKARLNRANTEGEQIFYASSSSRAIFLSTRGLRPKILQT